MLLSEALNDLKPYDIEVIDYDFSVKHMCGTVTVNASDCICTLRDTDESDVDADIVFGIDFSNIEVEDHEPTIVPYGSTYVTSDAGGTVLSDYDVYPEVVEIQIDGKPVDEEQFKQILSLTDEEYNIVMNTCKKSAEHYAEEWIDDHADDIIERLDIRDY